MARALAEFKSLDRRRSSAGTIVNHNEKGAEKEGQQTEQDIWSQLAQIQSFTPVYYAAFPKPKALEEVGALAQ